MLTIDSKIQTLPRINEKYADALKRLGILTVRDFLLHFPFRYEDYSERVPIDELIPGASATIMGEVTQSKLVRTWKKKMLITECFIADDTGTVRAVWFNQPYVSDSLIEGKGVRLSGKVSEDKKGLYFSNPAWERSSREPTNTGRLVPVYPETEGITSRWIRWQLQTLLALADDIADLIPADILAALSLPSLKIALHYIHFPKSEDQYLIAQKRFAFQNMLTVQLASMRAKNDWQKQKAVPIPFPKAEVDKFIAALPFTLTGAQQKASQEIFQDLERPKPMNRLLNGDVGSGKTVVAALAGLAVMRANYQAALMAPTEVLARQHFESISQLFSNHAVTIALLTNSYQMISDRKGGMQNTSRIKLLENLTNGKINLAIGTHALIQKDVRFKNLALVIVDEQHRFGVNQRAYLQQETEEMQDGLKATTPHLLSMTATPIPRSLALAFFGNLDLSVLDEMPKNRKPIITKIVTPLKRQEMYDFVRQEIANGQQAFIIFPLVEESSKMSELKAATQEHARLSKEIFPDLKLGLLHGRLKSNEKENVMKDYVDKKYDILVATSVVEVGLDVPNASIMVIEDAERFGLSQLHQFRGRVGRSGHQSYCFLLSSNSTVKGKSRMGALEKSNDGFEIAEQDLKLRGPGEFLGTRQSGIPDVAMQHIGNVKLIEISKKYAEQILKADPTLKNHPLLKKEIEKFSTTVHLE